jgi:CheY-like chemotaxis protein/anti-sigma regulatory factor (Ser/Thr protein kinase)
MERLINVAKFKMDEKKQTLTVTVDESIPDNLTGDDQRLSQVMMNLLNNAAKFTPEGGTIYLDAELLYIEHDECTLQITVRDTGIGISEEQQQTLFQPFTQAESDTVRKYGGTGLGLAISKRLVEMMDGDIRIESELGNGASFIFTVVLKSTPVCEQAEASEDDGGDDVFEGRTVLLVDDIELNREIVTVQLEAMMINVECAENGEEAVKAFSAGAERYDLIFMDLQMPLMDGYEATRQIRAMDSEKAKNIPIIAMTANVFRDDVEKCLNSGMNGHLGKPLNFAEVCGVLRKYFK